MVRARDAPFEYHLPVGLDTTKVMNNRSIREHTHRLKPEDYIGRRSVAFTACVEGRERIFNDPDIIEAFVPILGRSAERFGCAVPIYTFMPDHLHVLMIGEREDSDLKRAMVKFKAALGWWLYRNRPQVKLLGRFWDHVVREFEGWRSQARYIAANLCRAGLCKDVFDWPHTGTIGFNLNEVLQDTFW